MKNQIGKHKKTLVKRVTYFALVLSASSISDSDYSDYDESKQYQCGSCFLYLNDFSLQACLIVSCIH